MFWNGSRNAASLGSIAAVARSGMNAAIQICGRFALTSRTPKSRLLLTVTHIIGSAFVPIVCANGAHRPHELVSAPDASKLPSLTGGDVPSDFITHSDADGL